jgi:hypothetical protein
MNFHSPIFLVAGVLLGAVLCGFSNEPYGMCILDVLGGDLPTDMVEKPYSEGSEPWVN